MRHAIARVRGAGWGAQTSASSCARVDSSHIEQLGAAFNSGSLPEGVVPRSPLRGVQWSILLAGFLAYVAVIVTYKLPIGDVMMGIAVLGLIVQRNHLRVPPFIVLFALFVMWSALGLLHTEYPLVVWDHVGNDVKVLLVALVAANALRTRAQIRLFAVCFLGCFALFPVRGAMFNYFIAHYTLFGRAIWNYIYQNPNDFAALTLLQFSMAVGLAITEPRGWVRWAARAGVVVLPLVVLLTQSRGAFIALTAMITVMIAMQRGRRVRVIASIFIVGTLVATVIPSSAWERFRALSHATSTATLAEVDSEGSASNRYAVWTVAFRIIANNPILGVGLGGYGYAHSAYTLSSTELAGGARGYRDTHSTYLNLAAEVGIPGLLLFLAMIGITLHHAEGVRRAYASDRPKATTQLLYLELGLFAFLVAGVFGSFAKLSFLYLHIALIWACAQQCLDGAPSFPPPRTRRQRFEFQAGWRTAQRPWRSA